MIEARIVTPSGKEFTYRMGPESNYWNYMHGGNHAVFEELGMSTNDRIAHCAKYYPSKWSGVPTEAWPSLRYHKSQQERTMILLAAMEGLREYDCVVEITGAKTTPPAKLGKFFDI